MNELKVFQNPEFGQLRMILIDGKQYFMASDVAKALGYTNPNKAINDHCRAITKCYTPISGKEQEVNFIPEGDVYRLIVRSKLPKAEEFEYWVFDEVLPSIHKHGVYMTPEKIEEVLSNPDTIIELAMKLKEERAKSKRLETEVAQKEQMILEMHPKVSYYDLILQTPDLLSVTTIAKDYGKSAQWLNEYLHEKGVQYRSGKIWLLYQKYAEQGYTSSKTHTYTDEQGAVHSKVHTYWTQKGRLFLYGLLKEDGVLPLIEREMEAVS